MPDQPPTPPPPPPEVPSERRARPAVLWGALAAAAAVVVALVVVGVTVDDGDGGQQTVAPAGLELDQLEPALLTGDEVADGYREIRTSSDDSGALEDAFETDSEGCRELLDLMDGGRDDEPELEVAFARPDGRSVEQSMALVDEDEPTMSEVRDHLEDCDELTFEEQGTTGTVTFDDIGDEGPTDDAVSFAMDIEISTAGVTASVDGYLVMWNRGGVASMVGAMGTIDEQTLESVPADRDQARDLAEVADGKLADVLAGV